MFELYPEQRAEGEIVLDGENLLTSKQDVSLIRAKIGMVFQKPTPFPMSIYDNIAFGVKLFETLPRVEMDERVEWALQEGGAVERGARTSSHQSGSGLSGGQQQRLCIARGIAIKPEVLLLDEPCSALDPISTGKIEELIHELKNDYTVVIVTHNMQQAARVLRLHRLHVPGRPDRVRRDRRRSSCKPKKQGDRGLHHRPLRLTDQEHTMTDKHLSTQFDAELSGISTRVLEMGGLVESQVAQAVYALTQLQRRDRHRRCWRTEERVNQMEVEIDRDLSTIIARRQPTARDLRLLIAISQDHRQPRARRRRGGAHRAHRAAARSTPACRAGCACR